MDECAGVCIHMSKSFDIVQSDADLFIEDIRSLTLQLFLYSVEQ